MNDLVMYPCIPQRQLGAAVVYYARKRHQTTDNIGKYKELYLRMFLALPCDIQFNILEEAEDWADKTADVNARYMDIIREHRKTRYRSVSRCMLLDVYHLMRKEERMTVLCTIADSLEIAVAFCKLLKSDPFIDYLGRRGGLVQFLWRGCCNKDDREDNQEMANE